MAETTPTTRWPRPRAPTRRSATWRIFSESATDVPPNFMTTVPRLAAGGSGSTRATVSKAVSVMRRL
jgi:hypothetical protein